MHEPAPSSAASDDTPTTNFGRMETVPLFLLEATSNGPQKRRQEYHRLTVELRANILR